MDRAMKFLGRLLQAQGCDGEKRAGPAAEVRDRLVARSQTSLATNHLPRLLSARPKISAH
jgi:hypothetical protein